MDKGYLLEVMAIIKSLVLSCPEETSIEKLNKDFRKTEGYSLPYDKLGFSSVESFLRSIPETVYVDGSGWTAKVISVSNKKTQHMYDFVSRQKNRKLPRQNIRNKSQKQVTHFANNRRHSNKSNTRKFNSHINGPKECGFIDRIENVYTDTKTLKIENTVNAINNHPNGCNYKNKNKVESNPRCETKNVELLHNQIAQKSIQKGLVSHSKLNFASRKENDASKEKIVDDLANKLMDDFSLKTVPNNQYEQPNTDKCNTPDRFDVADQYFEEKKLIKHLDFPKNAVTCGIKIAPYTVINEVNAGEIVSIYVSEVHSPLKFWFHIPKTLHSLDILIYQMQNVYSQMAKDAFCIFPECITTGLLCAARFEDMWFRAEILTPLISGRAKVFFIDYGTVAFVDANNIKFLHENLANIPRLALRGSLSHIMPYDQHWTLQSTKALVDMMGDSAQSAMISDIDRNEQIFYMVICCKSDNNVVQINKRLVQERYALFDEMWKEKLIKKTGNSWQRENFPTFLMLECGEYPTRHELWTMLMQGCDYVQIIDRIFFYPYKLNDCKNAPKEIRDLPFPLHITNPFRGDIAMQLKLIR